MQVEVIYHHGTLMFNRPLRFRQTHFTMQVDIPEQVLDEAEEVSFPTFDLSLFSTEVRAEIARLEAIQRQAISQPVPEVEVEETEEQRLRWAALELRNEIRREQGCDQ
ncbi:MAG: hypothetical protein KJ675_16800 [Gammaproteobacteria bacterium]|nr:hypothetical protein [Gammaproteobacteria bacterium]